MNEKPKIGAGDLGYTFGRVILAAVPVLGAPAAELLSLAIEPPLIRRRDEWVESISQGLKLLEGKVAGFEIRSLAEDPIFLTAVLHATQSAIRSHQREKLDALRNAVLNVALHRAPDEDVQLMFLGFVDALAPWHLRILKYFDEHPTHTQSGYESGELLAIYPDLDGREEWYEQIVRDLYIRGLVLSNVTAGTATGFMPYTGHTSALGKTFLRFIASPVNNP